jgi:hypothetical protein
MLYCINAGTGHWSVVKTDETRTAGKKIALGSDSCTPFRHITLKFKELELGLVNKV